MSYPGPRGPAGFGIGTARLRLSFKAIVLSPVRPVPSAGGPGSLREPEGRGQGGRWPGVAGRLPRWSGDSERAGDDWGSEQGSGSASE